MKKVTGDCCGVCKFYDNFGPSEVGQDYGVCIRFPPAHVENGISVFPMVYSLSWCGEFKAREDSNAKNSSH